MSDLLIAYAFGATVSFFVGLVTWLWAEGDRLRQDQRRVGAQVALLAWAWPIALPIAIVSGLIWLIRELFSDALDY